MSAETMRRTRVPPRRSARVERLAKPEARVHEDPCYMAGLGAYRQARISRTVRKDKVQLLLAGKNHSVPELKGFFYPDMKRISSCWARSTAPFLSSQLLAGPQSESCATVPVQYW
jgi:hypothetical protein